MSSIERAMKGAMRRLPNTASQMIEAQSEFAIWKHQQVGERNPLSDNAMGIDPAGRYWKTKDHPVKIQRQGIDQDGRSIIYGKFEPILGDLIVTLAGRPQTADAALRSQRVGIYRVVDYDVRRDPDEKIVYTKIFVVPDRSGQNSDYAFNGDPFS